MGYGERDSGFPFDHQTVLFWRYIAGYDDIYHRFILGSDVKACLLIIRQKHAGNQVQVPAY